MDTFNRHIASGTELTPCAGVVLNHGAMNRHERQGGDFARHGVLVHCHSVNRGHLYLGSHSDINLIRSYRGYGHILFRPTFYGKELNGEAAVFISLHALSIGKRGDGLSAFVGHEVVELILLTGLGISGTKSNH